MPPVKSVEHIRVCVRIRPTLPALGEDGSINGAEAFDEQTVRVPLPGSSKVVSRTAGGEGRDSFRSFPFERVFGPADSQDAVYRAAAADVVENSLEGFKGTIVAYGATGSGKTRTILGDPAALSQVMTAPEDAPFAVSEELGLVPRAVADIFLGLEIRGIKGGMVELSYLEIYDEQLTDLLFTPTPSDPNPPTLDITTPSPSAPQPLVTNLSKRRFDDPRTLLIVIVEAASRRRLRSTERNEHSSRSHTWCVLEVLEPRYPGSDRLFSAGRLQFLDLAGSENIARSNVTGQGVREAGSINKSLLALGRVIQALNSGAGHVPWRDGMVTRLLQDSLGGTTLTTFIACVSPNPNVSGETFNTLSYASSVRKIENKPERTVDYVKNVGNVLNSAAISGLKAQIIERDEVLRAYSERVGVLEGEVARLRGLLEGEREKNATRTSAAHTALANHATQLPDLLASQLGKYMEGFSTMMLSITEQNAELARGFAAGLSGGIKDGIERLKEGVEGQDTEIPDADDLPNLLSSLPVLPPLPAPLDPADKSRTPSPPISPPRRTSSTEPSGLMSPHRPKSKLVPGTPSSKLARSGTAPGTPRSAGGMSARKPPLPTPGRGVLKPSNSEIGETPSKKRKLDAASSAAPE